MKQASVSSADRGFGKRRLVTLALVRIHRPADHFNGRAYLLLGCQLVPTQNRLLQGGAISQSVRSIVQRCWPPRVDIDFGTSWSSARPILFGVRRTAGAAGFLILSQSLTRPERSTASQTAAEIR